MLQRLRGRASNRKRSAAHKQRTLELVRERMAARLWHDWGPTLLAETLGAEHGLPVGRETLRKWLVEAGLRRPRRRKVERAHIWRQRRARAGELVQWDTSEHDWLEGRGPKLYLIALLDDATSRAYARFVESGSSAKNRRTLGGYVERHGRPLAVYTDKASLFVTAPKGVHHRDAPAAQPTQVGRALAKLGVEWIAAHSPQAKGRIERFFQTAQDRLVKGLRQAGAATLEAADEYLERVWLPAWNERFTRPPASAADAHRPLDPEHDLAAILSRVESRRVGDDCTLRLGGRLYQIPREHVRPGLRGQRVAVEQRLDCALAVRFRGRLLPLALCVERPPAPSSAAKPPRRPPAPRAASAKARRCGRPCAIPTPGLGDSEVTSRGRGLAAPFPYHPCPAFRRIFLRGSPQELSIWR